MKREELLRERLKRYSASETAAFHMPGHKRHMEYGLLRDFPNAVLGDIKGIYRGKIHQMKYWSL